MRSFLVSACFHLPPLRHIGRHQCLEQPVMALHPQMQQFVYNHKILKGFWLVAKVTGEGDNPLGRTGTPLARHFLHAHDSGIQLQADAPVAHPPLQHGGGVSDRLGDAQGFHRNTAAIMTSTIRLRSSLESANRGRYRFARNCRCSSVFCAALGKRENRLSTSLAISIA